MRAAVLSAVFLANNQAFCADVPGGYRPIDRSLAEESIQVCREEESRARTSSWIWGLSGVALGSYAIAAFAGRHGNSSGLKYFAAIGTLGAAGACWNSSVRRWGMRELRNAMAIDVSASGADPGFSIETVRKVGNEFRKMHAGLLEVSEGSLRAGCVVPVLLSGMAVFGFAMGGTAGADLSGICLVGALGIGGPSMLYYSNIKRDLDRMDALMKKWDESFREKKKEGKTQWE